MKRTPLRRQPKASRPRAEVLSSRMFKVAFQGQPCAVCGREWRWPEVHHVVSQQHIRSRGREDVLWSPDNGLSLCPRGLGCDAHERHTNASQRIPREVLSEHNVIFAREVLGAYAADYLDRYYPREA